MTNTSATKLPIWFWAISIIAIIWNLLGILGFFATINMSPEALAALPEAEQEIYNSTPIWVNVAFAIAVFAGTIGSLGLVLRKRWAKPLLIASLAGVLAQMFHAFVLSNGLEVYGLARMAMPIMIVLIGVFLIWFAGMVEKKGWI